MGELVDTLRQPHRNMLQLLLLGYCLEKWRQSFIAWGQVGWW